MTAEQIEFVTAKTRELLAADHTCQEARDAADAWLKAAAAGRADEAIGDYLKELEEDIISTDMLLAFAQSDHAKQVFGEEGQKGFVAHVRSLKDAGQEYCDCPSCQAALAIVEKKAELL